MSVIHIEQENPSQYHSNQTIRRSSSNDQSESYFYETRRTFVDLSTQQLFPVHHSQPSENDDDDDEQTKVDRRRLKTQNSIDEILQLIDKDRREFLFSMVSSRHDDYFRCRLVRELLGSFERVRLDLLPSDDFDSNPIPLLFAEKNGDTLPPCRYFIFIINENHARSLSVELLFNNILGTSYTLFDLTNERRRTIAQIDYETNFIGFNGPRMLKAILLRSDHSTKYNMHKNEIDSYDPNQPNPSLIYLENQVPFWNSVVGCYTLKFDGKYRPATPSLKNFQMILNQEPNERQIVLQMCRSDDNLFYCDIRSPLSFIQAFGIMLTAFESRLCRK